MVYLLANEKGGVGKSTLAVSLAIYLYNLGRRVAVLDADKQLHAASAITNAEPNINVVAEFDPNKIPVAIQSLKLEYDDIVADAPAKMNDETRALMVMADVAIFPIEPSIKSLMSTKESIRVLEYARSITGGSPKFGWIVVNRVNTRTRMFREIKEVASTMGLSLAATAVRAYLAYPQADEQGTVVARMKPNSDAIVNAQKDLVSLFREIVISEQKKVANV